MFYLLNTAAKFNSGVAVWKGSETFGNGSYLIGWFLTLHIINKTSLFCYIIVTMLLSDGELELFWLSGSNLLWELLSFLVLSHWTHLKCNNSQSQMAWVELTPHCLFQHRRSDQHKTPTSSACRNTGNNEQRKPFSPLKWITWNERSQVALVKIQLLSAPFFNKWTAVFNSSTEVHHYEDMSTKLKSKTRQQMAMALRNSISYLIANKILSSHLYWTWGCKNMHVKGCMCPILWSTNFVPWESLSCLQNILLV